jgi:hypothetical protein
MKSLYASNLWGHIPLWTTKQYNLSSYNSCNEFVHLYLLQHCDMTNIGHKQLFRDYSSSGPMHRDYAKSPSGSFEKYSISMSLAVSSCGRVSMPLVVVVFSWPRVFCSYGRASEELWTTCVASRELKWASYLVLLYLASWGSFDIEEQGVLGNDIP